MPAELNVFQLSAKVLDDISVYLNKAVVFLDDASAEVMHWHGAATMLFNCGALDVREFSSFESAETTQRKAVFFVSEPLSEVSVSDKLQAIITASNFLEINVFTTICSTMHSIIEYGPVGVTDDDARAFTLYRNEILAWMHKANKTSDNCTVQLHYLPIVMAPVLPSMFVLPSVQDVFPLLPTDIDFIRQGQHKVDKAVGLGQSEIDFASLPRKLQLKLKLLACNLNSVLEVFGCSEDIFAVGQTSNIVATELAGLSWSKHRKKTAQRKASLLLVDRTLDIASVVGHFHDTMLDKIMSVLHRLPGHSTDVSVDMSPVCSIVSNPNVELIVPGCLGHPDDPVATSMLGALAVLKHKEALMEINRLVAESVSKELHDVSASTARPGKSASVEQIASMLQQFRGKQTSIRRHCGLLQLAMAAVQALRHPGSAKTDSLLAEEKGLLQCIDDEDSPSVIEQIVKNITVQLKHLPSERTHTVTDFLLLVAFVYSLIDSENVNFESNNTELETALSKFLLCSRESCDQLILDLVGENWSQENCLRIVRESLRKLCSLNRARDMMKQYRNIHEPGSLSSQARLKPLLRQIVEDIVDNSRPDLVDINHKSAGFGDLLKSGFGFFRSVGKPRLGDHPLLIIFVIGGATSTEVRQIRDVVAAAKTNVQVLLGSTALVTPVDVLRRLIVQDNLHPS